MGTNHLKVTFCSSPKEAPKYTSPKFKSATLDEAVFVDKGTVQGSPTIDLIFTDSKGQKYIAMITAAILRTIVEAGGGR